MVSGSALHGVGRSFIASLVTVASLGACSVLIGLDDGSPRTEPTDGGLSDAPPVAPGADAGASAVYNDIADPQRWELFSVGKLDSNLTASTGFAGALFDGRFVRFVPNGGCTAGAVTAFDSVLAFTDAASWSVFDLRTVDANARGFFGGAFDGKRLYLAPDCTTTTNLDGTEVPVASSLVATHDVSADAGAWEVHSVSAAGAGAAGFRGAVFDGRYVYFVPEGPGRVVVRYDTRDSGFGPTALSTFDPQTLTPPAGGFTGGVFDGQNVYFAPSSAGATCSSVVARFDTHGEFLNKGYWTSFDLKNVNGSASWCRFGAVFDGRYVYLVPNGGRLLARLDTTMPFANASSWSVFDILTLNAGSTSFGGAAFDGRYVYLLPAASSSAPSVVLRLDTLADLQDSASWTSFDLATKDPTAKGFAGAAFDGRWVYLAPSAGALTAARFDARTPPGVPGSYRGSFL